MTSVLKQQIVEHIQSTGPITFAEFMQRALYTPQLGYYMRSQLPFGEGGDFTTAPELSPLLARCLANRYLAVREQVGDVILEIGPGSGVLAVELLKYLQALDALPSRYVFLELSGHLAAHQKARIEQALPDYIDQCEWLTAWPSDRLSGVVIANELFDAMPVHIIEAGANLQERFVTLQDGQLAWALGKPSSALEAQWCSYALGDMPAGYTTEINLLIQPWMNALSEAVNNVHCMFIDYGYKREVYYHPERSMGTVLCHYHHQTNEDFFERIGEQDITAHVDFTLILESALNVGLQLVSFQTQSQFMLTNGLTDMLATIKDDAEQAALTQQAKQLIMPGQMGEAFKVLELSR